MSTKQNANQSNSNKRNSSRRGYSKPKQKEVRSEKNFDEAKLNKGQRDNDPNWYFSSPELANQAAELSFQSFIGEGTVIDLCEAPTCMAIYLNPSPGPTYAVSNEHIVPGPTEVLPNYSDWRSSWKDGVNLASQKLYTLLSTFSGRTSSYSPADIGTMILAIGEVASISECIRRYFGMALTYNMRNRAMPTQIMRMLGCEAIDLTKNIADYRMRFNTAMTRINQIPLLDNIGYIRKCRELYQKIYVDEPSVMAQMYAYVPATSWVLSEESDPQGSVLETIDVLRFRTGSSTIGIRNMNGWLEILEEMIDKLLSSSTLNIVYADILNLASRMNVPLWQFDYLAEDYVVIPEYDANFLLQVHNMDILGAPRYVQGGASTPGREEHGAVGKKFMVTRWNNVYHDASKAYLLYNPVFTMVSTTGDGRQYRDTIVDMMTDNPSLEDRIESLRFSVARSGFHVKVNTWTAGGSTAVQEELDVFPSISDHYVAAIHMFGANDTHDDPSITPAVMFDTTYMSNDVLEDGQYSDQIIPIGWYMSQFKYAPRFYYHSKDSYLVEAITGDLDYYTSVDYAYLARLNRIMYAGLFEFRV